MMKKKYKCVDVMFDVNDVKQKRQKKCFKY
jgi:hypothetical protein